MSHLLHTNTRLDSNGSFRDVGVEIGFLLTLFLNRSLAAMDFFIVVFPKEGNNGKLEFRMEIENEYLEDILLFFVRLFVACEIKNTHF